MCRRAADEQLAEAARPHVWWDRSPFMPKNGAQMFQGSGDLSVCATGSGYIMLVVRHRRVAWADDRILNRADFIVFTAYGILAGALLGRDTHLLVLHPQTLKTVRRFSLMETRASNADIFPHDPRLVVLLTDVGGIVVLDLRTGELMGSAAAWRAPPKWNGYDIMKLEHDPGVSDGLVHILGKCTFCVTRHARLAVLVLMQAHARAPVSRVLLGDNAVMTRVLEWLL